MLGILRMMRNTVMLALGILVAVLLPRAGTAQEISFSGRDIIQLAKTIVTETSRTDKLPSAYQMTMTNGHTMIVTAPTVFELLTRAIIAWKNSKAFPATVPVQLLDLTGPAPDPQYEPKRAGLVIAVPTVDIGTYAQAWLGMAEAPGHRLLKVMTFETKYQLTAAQIIVTEAKLIDDTVRRTEFPDAVAVPLVRSPEDWQDTHNPVAVVDHVDPPAQQLVEADLQLSLNGVELSERGPVLHNGEKLPPFCGNLRIVLTGFGHLTAIRLLLDNEELSSYKTNGPHTYEIDTVRLDDDTHTIAATAVDDTGKTYAYVFSFAVRNGRKSDFNPAPPEGLERTMTPLTAPRP